MTILEMFLSYSVFIGAQIMSVQMYIAMLQDSPPTHQMSSASSEVSKLQSFLSAFGSRVLAIDTLQV
jgi:hypothetical protein